MSFQAGRQLIAFGEARRKVVMVFVIPAAYFITILVTIAAMVAAFMAVAVVITVFVFATVTVLVMLPVFVMVTVVSNGDTGECEYRCRAGT